MPRLGNPEHRLGSGIGITRPRKRFHIGRHSQCKCAADNGIQPNKKGTVVAVNTQELTHDSTKVRMPIGTIVHISVVTITKECNMMEIVCILIIIVIVLILLTDIMEGK